MIRLGVARLWCPHTIQEVIGIDERHVAARGFDNQMFVWDHRTGELVSGVDARSIGHGDGPIPCDVGSRTQVKVSSDRRWVAAASIGSRIRVYDNGVMKFADDPEYEYSAVTFSQDGTRVVGTADCAHVWTLGEDTPRLIKACARGGTLDAAGNVVGGAYTGMVGRWSLDNTELARISVRHKIESLSISYDGRYGAVTTYATGGLCMWAMPDVVVADFAGGRAILRFHDGDDVTRVATLSPDARWLALTDAEGIRLLPAAPLPAWTAPPVVARWPGRSIAFSRDDRAVVTHESVAKLISIPSGDVLASTPIPEDTWPRWSPDGRFLAEIAPDERLVRFRSTRDLEVIGEQAFEHPVFDFALAPDGTRIAVTDGPTLLIVDVPHDLGPTP